MKCLVIALSTLFLSLSAKASECEKIYSNESFYLCAKKSDDDELFPFPVYDVFAVHIGTGRKSFIANERFINDVSNVIKVSDTEFFYKAYMGGNSPPSEHRHVLIVIHDSEVSNAGVFSGYADIDDDSALDYFLLSLSEMGSARAFDKYTKVKLVLRNNRLVRDK
ncbi:hypothetical protein PRUB_a0598 [Pseudoalteromonas rubra]|uniref:Uncharacterized protein n=1 Tax=Pseudoalteromonas rubra TaxID=43658 RepID=A0A8T0C613_9GAMM|nr:hypothetical protein [Pseudoalteromonas rubra]KAF7786129.1 hypothetical protein PRUB_a0598 [Pseudoalteromonas rubra]